MNNSSLKILITGGNGQIAHALSLHPRAREFQITSCARQDLDITSVASINKAFEKFEPQVIINTAAYTAVDKAEQEIDLANLANHLGAENLACICEEHHIPLIHLSTDYIFDGTNNAGYSEDDPPNPINQYGKSKWLGEQAVNKQCEQHIILRVSGVFSEHGNNFFNTMLKLAKNKTAIRVVADQITCPTYAGDIADAIFTIIKKPGHWGTYHYCSTPEISWHQFAKAILDQDITAITTAEYPTPAKRPAYSVLNCNKIESIFGIKQPSWQHALWKLQ
jgi:dTDP-4-dehydrorhamnose reductase